jgi:hypothetical protein
LSDCFYSIRTGIFFLLMKCIAGQFFKPAFLAPGAKNPFLIAQQSQPLLRPRRYYATFL